MRSGRSTFRVPVTPTRYALAVASGMLLLLTGWYVIARFEVFPSAFFPGPLDVAQVGARMFRDQEFFLHIAASVARIGAAFVIAAALAVPLGLMMSSFKLVEGFFEPVIEFVRYVPVPSLVPIFVLWTGIGETTKFLILFFGTFFQLVLLVMDDADNVPRIYFDTARTLGAGTVPLMRDVLVPYLLPQIYDRLRVTLGWCWTYLVIAELVAVNWGIGHTIKEAQRFNAASELFVCFIVLGAIGLVTDFLMNRGHAWLFPYTVKAQAEI